MFELVLAFYIFMTVKVGLRYEFSKKVYKNKKMPEK